MKIKFPTLILTLLLCCTIIQCKYEDKSVSNKTPKVVIPEDKVTKKSLLIKLVTETKIDSAENPKTKIMLRINNSNYEIADVMGIPTKMPGAIFPKNALDSCITWWAGTGDFFYVIKKGKKVIVYKDWDGEGNEDGGYNWEITKEKII